MVTSRKFILALIAGVLAITLLGYYYFFTGMLSASETRYVYIDQDDDIDSVYAKLDTMSSLHGMTAFRTISRHGSYAENIRTGRYEIEPSNGAFTVFKKLKGGQQSALRLTIPCVRTMDRLAGYLSTRLMVDSLDMLRALTDSAECARYGFTPETMPCLFIPDTYDVYWNVPVEKFLDRMADAHKAFWTEERLSKAKAAGLTKEEVATLASIVDEETSVDGEKAMIAGLYINRLERDMPLQADPTVRFALGDFTVKRIYYNMLKVDSPYNTYLHEGLPPGPIRIPTIKGVEAVLNHAEHDYIYMCAKEDFSGTHNFAETAEEHMANAKKYAEALNAREIK